MNQRILIVFLVVATILYWFSLQMGLNQGKQILGKPLPDFTLIDEKGDKVHLRDYRGKSVLLHFWATWCPPCVHEMPSLNKFYQSQKSDSFVLLAISVDEEGMSVVNSFKQKVPFDFPTYFDPSGKLTSYFGTYRFPESFLVDANGVVVKKIIGPQNWELPVWQQEIQKILEKK